MRWKGRRVSTNLEDRRGGAGAKAGGISILGLIVAFVAWEFFGVDPQQAYQATQQVTAQQSTASALENPTPEQQEAANFVGTILADTEDTWAPIFKKKGAQYQSPKLVLFSGVVNSGCGTAQSAMGPFYCPADQKVYIDTSFFQQMRQELGVSGEQNQTELSRRDQAGDFAQAYVIAHEVGHHIQTITGISEQVQQQQRSQVGKVEANQLSVRQELQADCFAGIWAHHNQQRTQFLEQGDIAEAMDAAHKIGDDYLQKRSTGQVVPDSFTHGSSEQRQRWFERGWQTGDMQQCDTFSVRQL